MTETAPSLEHALADNECKASYPRLTWANATGCDAIHIAPSPDNTRTLQLEWLNAFDNSRSSNTHADAAIAHTLGARLRSILTDDDGTMRGCVAVICNTVARAQEVYRSLCAYFATSDDKPQLDLLHARFLFHQRAAREAHTLERFGKPSSTSTNDTEIHRPRCAILVATQIIEQSLDIDFDLMISEFAPVDLLLQRAGRLHRHTRQEPRPPKLQRPTLMLIKPELDTHGIPDFGSSAYVYDSHILLRSWLTLKEKTTVEIPREVENLIEVVYDDALACPQTANNHVHDFWLKTAEKLSVELKAQERNAKHCRLLQPDYDTDEFLEDFMPPLEEDNPDIHASLQARTRDDSLPSVNVVCLHPAELHHAKLRDKRDIAAVKFFLERSVSLAKQGAVQAILALDTPDSWHNSPHLRRHRLLDLDEQGCKSVGDFSIRLDAELGIVIAKR